MYFYTELRLSKKVLTYIENVISANILSATTPGIKHEVLNVANGKDNTVLELVHALNRIIGKDIEPKFLDPRPGDVYRTFADLSKAEKTISYKPLVNFEQGLEKTVAYFKEKGF